MKTFIVPTDFSDTSKNAARFAAQVALEVRDCRILLYNVFDKIETGSDSSVLYNDHESRRKIMELALESVKIDMLTVAPGIKVDCLAEEEGSFINSLERLARHEGADMIIMGITGSTRLSQIFIGSNTLSMVNKNVCPVMIVPPDATFTGIKKMVFTSDFKDIATTTPVKALRSVLDTFKPFLYIVNVDSEHYVELSEDYKTERAKLDEMLKDYDKEYFFIRMYDFMEAINQFTADNQIDLIMTVPKNHSFLTGLFRSNYTKKLAYHSHVPLIAVHE
ncbi:MAG: universal stress protein [Gemmatimonadaceae bacterium]|nr:universal stress protein [Chitinophagaceae bacterium]